MARYSGKIAYSGNEVTLVDNEEIKELIRGYAAIYGSDFNGQTVIHTVTYEAEDMWELRGLIEDIVNEIRGINFVNVETDKPQLITDA